MKALKSEIEKENSYPQRIIIERLGGMSLSDCYWEVTVIPWGTWSIGKFGIGKHIKGKSKQGIVSDKDMEKVLKVINNLKEYK